MVQTRGDADVRRRSLSPSSPIENTPSLAVLEPLIRAISASGSVLSVHFDGGTEAKVLATTGCADDDRSLAATIALHASDSLADPSSRGTRVAESAWLTTASPSGRTLLSIVFQPTQARTDLVFSAVFGGNGSPDQKLVAATLKRLLPTLDAYFSLWQRHRQECRQNSGLRSALDSVDLGIVLIDGEGNPCFANAAGAALLTDGRFLKQRASTIRANNFQDTMRLQAALGSAIDSNAGRSSVDPAGAQDSAQLKLTSLSGDEHLIVAILPAEQPADEPGSVAALLILLKPDGEPEKIAAPVCKIFGLSGVETRLACQLVTGRSLAEACDTMRIRETTGRGYLKQIFAKTNVNRQAELVRVLLSGIVRARSKGLIQVI